MKCVSSINALVLVLLSYGPLTSTSTIFSKFSCYSNNQTFSFSFNMTSPQVGDVVAIRRNGTGRNLLISATTCKALPCTKIGSLSMAESLAAGVYRAVMLRSNRVTVLATSRTFSLQLACAPSKTPTKMPTKKPSQRPTASPTALTVYEHARQIMSQALVEITDMVQANSRLTPMFLRMGFHDCIHVCDGCIDLTNPANFGLEGAISALDPIVAKSENKAVGISRADLWALAVMAGADAADHGALSKPINFTQNWFGRVNCEDAGQVCRNNVGQPVPCSSTVGPNRRMAEPTLNSDSIFTYFADEFAFNQRQVIAIMGAHSVGRLFKAESGINGPNGWTFNNAVLQNEYYNALMGAASAATPKTQIVSLSPRWRRVFQNNSGTVFSDVNTWGMTVGGKSLVMLNTDISLVRHLDDTNADPVTGAVSCAFNDVTAAGSPVCPLTSTVGIVAQFSDSNDLWMTEFRDTLDLMLTNGYTRTECSGTLCPLTLMSSIINPPPTAAPTTGSAKPTVSPVSAPISSSKAPLLPTGSPTPGSAKMNATLTFSPLPGTNAPMLPTASPTSTPAATKSTLIQPKPAPGAPTFAPITPPGSPTASPILSTVAPIQVTTPPSSFSIALTFKPSIRTSAPALSPTMLTFSSVTPTRHPTPAPTSATSAPILTSSAPSSTPAAHGSTQPTSHAARTSL